MKLGEKIKELRKNAKMTQKELASKINITSSTVAKYELGLVEPTLDTIFKISTALNISALELIFSDYKPSKDYNDFLQLFKSGNMTTDNVHDLFDCLILTIIKNSNLTINIDDISDNHKEIMFSMCSNIINGFLKDLTNYNLLDK